MKKLLMTVMALSCFCIQQLWTEEGGETNYR